MFCIGAIAAGIIRTIEGRRLNYVNEPGYKWVGLSVMIGDVLGAKLGLIFYLDLDSF